MVITPSHQRLPEIQGATVSGRVSQPTDQPRRIAITGNSDKYVDFIDPAG
jgi:hypothetical protein